MTKVKPVAWRRKEWFSSAGMSAWAFTTSAERVTSEHEALVLLADHERAVEALRAENERKTRMLADCFRAAGADPDGRSDTQLAEDAVAAVTMLRKDYGEIRPLYAEHAVEALALSRAKYAERARLLETKLVEAEQRAERAEAEMAACRRVVASHIEDLERCVPVLKEYGLRAIAAEVTNAVSEPRSAIDQQLAQVEG